MEMRSVSAPPMPRSWWQRNWKWVVPVGVLGGFTVVASAVGLAVLFVFSFAKGTDLYTGAVAEAGANVAVIRELGEPIETGWWVSGSIINSGPSGTADFATPLYGPIGRGTLYVSAEKQAGRWTYKSLEVAIEGQAARIDVLRDRTGA